LTGTILGWQLTKAADFREYSAGISFAREVPDLSPVKTKTESPDEIESPFLSASKHIDLRLGFQFY